MSLRKRPFHAQGDNLSQHWEHDCGLFARDSYRKQAEEQKRENGLKQDFVHSEKRTEM